MILRGDGAKGILRNRKKQKKMAGLEYLDLSQMMTPDTVVD